MALLPDELEEIESWITGLQEVSNKLLSRERTFVEDMAAKIDRYGEDAYMTEPQKQWLEALAEQYCV
jgi:hypothetical protein